MASSVSAGSAPAPGTTVRLAGLGNRLLEVYARHLPRAEFAAETTRLLLDALRVKAVAILTYDTHADRLRLLADAGLSAEARTALGGGAECPWDLPLRGLHNRRISVIAAAQENPFVPRALVKLSPRALTLATLPLFHELKPVGVLLLVAAGHRAFPDSQLQQLSQVLRVGARGLLELEAPRVTAPPPEAATAEAVIARLVREGAVIEAPELGAVPEPEARPRLDTAVARLLRLEHELVETRGELARSEQSLRALTASYTAVSRERDGLAQVLADAEAAQQSALADLHAQVEALEQRVLAVDSERVRAQRLAETRQDESGKALAALDAERARLVEREAAALQAAAAAQVALEAERTARTELAERLAAQTAQEAEARQRIEDLETAVAAGRETFEEERARLAVAASTAAEQHADRVREIETQLAGAGDAQRETARLLAAVEAERDAARADVAAREAESATRLEERVAAAREIDELTRMVEALRAETTAAGVERMALAGQLGEARAALEREGRDVSERLAGAHKRLEELTAAIRQRDNQLSTVTAERQRLATQARTAEETVSRLEGRVALERAAMDADRQQWDAQLSRARAELDAAASRARELDDARAAAVSAGDTLRTQLADQQQVRQQVETDRDAARSAAAAAATEVAALRSELVALHGEREGLGRRVDETGAALRDLEDRAASAVREATAVAAALADRDRALATAQAAAAERETQLASALGERQQAVAELQAAQQAAAQALAEWQARDTEWAAERERLRAALEANEETAGTRTAALEAAGAELTTTRDRLEALERERPRWEETATALAAAQAELATARDAAAAAARHVEDLESRVAAARDEATAAEERRAALAAERDAERAEHAEAAAAAARDAERARAVDAALAEERAVRETERADRDVLQTTFEALQAERATLEAEHRDVAARLAAAHQQLAELTAALEERDSRIAIARAERQRLEEALQGAEATAAELSDERHELRRHAEEALAQTGVAELEIETAEEVVPVAEAPIPGLERHGEAFLARDTQIRRHEERSDALFEVPLTIERSVPVDVELEEPEEVEAADLGEAAAAVPEALAVGEIVLLDAGPRGDDARAVLENAGFAVTRAQVGEATVDDLARRKIHCVLLNLAGGPEAWRTLKLLRERSSTRQVPILAYILQPQATAGFCFRRADFGIWPMDPERIGDALGRLRPKLKRLLAVSADVDTAGRIREPLARHGISTSIVLDGKQALELAAIVAPEAVLLHLTPQCLVAARAVAGIRAAENTRDLPMLIALDKNPPREDAFLASAVRDLLTRPNFTLANLPGELAVLLG